MYDLHCPFMDRLNHTVPGGYPIDFEWQKQGGSIKVFLGEPVSDLWRNAYPEMAEDEHIELFVGFDPQYNPIRLRSLSCKSQALELVKRIRERGYTVSESLSGE